MNKESIYNAAQIQNKVAHFFSPRTPIAKDQIQIIMISHVLYFYPFLSSDHEIQQLFVSERDHRW